MRLWLLKTKRKRHRIAILVRAKSAVGARRIAADVCGAEGENTWIKANLSWCGVLLDKGIARVILREIDSSL